ncbi:MAG: ferritin-like domain-containing protein [Polyangiaceae bacterium]|nr:ferritin-like domain-containing protein [Polyangiaceae bacterium]
MADDDLDLSGPVELSQEARVAALNFFNAAFRAEESGLRQAHELAERFEARDPALAETLRLYGDEEGWHRELLTEFLTWLGGDVKPMGRVTRTLYRVYGSAKAMSSIVLTNLMFETIGSTTYRLTLRRVSQPEFKRMLTVLTRDESFHVPLNVHFLREVMRDEGALSHLKLRALHRLLFYTLVLLPLASRPKAQAFDTIGRLELMRAYATHLAELSDELQDLGLSRPALLLKLLGAEVRPATPVADIGAAERYADRSQVLVQEL